MLDAEHAAAAAFVDDTELAAAVDDDDSTTADEEAQELPPEEAQELPPAAQAAAAPPPSLSLLEISKRLVQGLELQPGGLTSVADQACKVLEVSQPGKSLQAQLRECYALI